jgi:hypothetical protein
MKLYNSRNNRVNDFPDHIANLRLTHNHVKNGGIYCLDSEISNYFDLKPSEEAKPEATPEPAQEGAEESPTDTSALSVKDLRALAVEKLGIDQAQANAMKKGELRDALESKTNS